MQGLIAEATPVRKKIYEFDYTIGTLVTDKREYEEMMDSFVKAGFGLDSCHYFYIDNSGENQFDAYSGLNMLLQQAQGEYVILCHQDILLSFDQRPELEHQIQQLREMDPNWAVAGNAGAAGPNHIVYKITYPDGTFMSKGNFPLLAQSLDENFLLLKNLQGLSFSADLTGFHLYGADICLQAVAKGYHSYVIDFNVLHKSRGNPDESFVICKKNLVKKYNHLFRDRWIQTTTTCFHLSGSLTGFVNNNALSLFCIRMWNGLKKRKN